MFLIGLFDLPILQHTIIRNLLSELRGIDLVGSIQKVVHDIPASIELLHHVSFAQHFLRKQTLPALNPPHNLLQIHARLVDPIEQNAQPLLKELALQQSGQCARLDAVAPFQNRCEVVDVLLVARIDRQCVKTRHQLGKHGVLEGGQRTSRRGAFGVEQGLQLGQNGFELSEIGERFEIGGKSVGEVREDVGIEAWKEGLIAEQRGEEENGLRVRARPALDLKINTQNRTYSGENSRCDRLNQLFEQHVGIPDLPRCAENLLVVQQMVLIERVERRKKRRLDERKQRCGEDGHDDKSVLVVVFLGCIVQPVIAKQMGLFVLFFLH